MNGVDNLRASLPFSVVVVGGVDSLRTSPPLDVIKAGGVADFRAAAAAATIGPAIELLLEMLAPELLLENQKIKLT
jgi:hypothetical protein